MARVPSAPKIYHITHLENLPKIVQAGEICSDTRRAALGLACRVVGMSHIKQRRQKTLAVRCHPGTTVGEYVPFYFCPRSIMLYILHMGNHPDLNYREGQRPIVHLQADLMTTIHWAEANRVRWAFSDRNAGGYLAHFYKSADDLDKINWRAVRATDFRDMVVKEGKQAEFLVYESFPWNLVDKIGVLNTAVAQEVRRALSGAAHCPAVSVESAWYY
jgi:hypothetical protein